MTSPTAITYVFYGQDEPGLTEKLAEFIAANSDPATADLNTLRLDGSGASLGEIENAARALPFLAETRLVLVDNLTASASGRAVIEQLGPAIQTLPDSTRLVFVETGLADDDHSPSGDSAGKRGAGRTAALKKLINLVESDPRGKIQAFASPSRDKLPDWLKARAKRYHAALDAGAARSLAERIGGDLVLADSELAKLATYAGSRRPITAEDVALLTPYSAEANIFKMVDALGERKAQIALRLLGQLLDNGEEPLRVFGMIIRQYRLLIQMREQLDAGLTVNAAGQALGLRDFVTRSLGEQARSYRIEHLERIFDILLETDVAIKTGDFEKTQNVKPAELALETLVVRLAGRG
jgi:DNA polymerase-3 subunit delta